MVFEPLNCNSFSKTPKDSSFFKLLWYFLKLYIVSPPPPTHEAVLDPDLPISHFHDVVVWILDLPSPVQVPVFHFCPFFS